jgi:hypothetical protein
MVFDADFRRSPIPSLLLLALIVKSLEAKSTLLFPRSHHPSLPKSEAARFARDTSSEDQLHFSSQERERTPAIS